jgi:hypothetical protein
MTAKSRSLRWDQSSQTASVTLNGVETTYRILDATPDKRVCDPAFSVEKVTAIKDTDGQIVATITLGTVYHVRKDKFGWSCCCADAVYRNKANCKHVSLIKKLLELQHIGVAP